MSLYWETNEVLRVIGSVFAKDTAGLKLAAQMPLRGGQDIDIMKHVRDLPVPVIVLDREPHRLTTRAFDVDLDTTRKILSELIPNTIECSCYQVCGRRACLKGGVWHQHPNERCLEHPDAPMGI